MGRDDLVMLRHLKRVKLGGESDVTNKQLHMVGNLFELCYGLVIPPDTNGCGEALDFFNS
jgi:hypothetical protein